MPRKRVPEEERDALRRWMRRALQASGLSANRLAKAAGVAQSTVTRFLNGYADYAPSQETIEKLAAVAGVDPPKFGDLEAGELSLLTENDEYRDLIREAVRLADRVVRDREGFILSITMGDDHRATLAALDKDRDTWLPHATLIILDTLADLKKRGMLDASAIEGIEASFKKMALDRHEALRAGARGNPLNPFPEFRAAPETKRSTDPQSEASDRPGEEEDSPPKKAAPGDDSKSPLAV